MHILVSNDDGYFSKGLKTLVSQLTSDGHKVSVVAPDRNMSGCSQSLTLRKPINVRYVDDGVYAVEGTPADCVHLALHGLIQHNIDLVVSGINHGANLGDDVLYSGTFAAAMEARRLSLPNIAVSITTLEGKYLTTAATITSRVIKNLDLFPLKEEVAVLNINVPDVVLSDLKGVKTTCLGYRGKSEAPKVEEALHGRLTYWIGPQGGFVQSNGNEDFMAIEQQYASITPLSSQLLHHDYLPKASCWVNDCLQSVVDA